jgi:VRR-NUC domain
MPPATSKPYPPKTLEKKLQADVLKCAKANGWRFDVEDCYPKYQQRSSYFLSRFFQKLKKPLDFLLARRGNVFTLAYHTFDSRNSQAGFPDLVLVHPRRGQIIFAELKQDTAYPSTEQRFWLAGLESAAHNCPNVKVVVWRPRDWPEIVQTLGGIDTRALA